MALIRCTECSREVSDKAAACPGCGAPLDSSKGAAPLPTEPQQKPSSEPDGTSSISGLAAVGYILATIGGFVLYASRNRDLQEFSGSFGLFGFFAIWIGLAMALTGASWVIRIGGMFIVTCLALIAVFSIFPSPEARQSGSGSSPVQRKSERDIVADLLGRELSAQQKGDTCAECWASDGERNRFKNLIEYSIKSSFTCTQKDTQKEIPGIIGISFRAKGQNGFGGQIWDDYEALGVLENGSWKLAAFAKVAEVGGQKLDMCMLAGVSGLLKKYGQTSR